MVTPAGKRKAVAHLVEAHGMSERRACKAIGCCRMTMRYRTTRADDAGIRQRMKAIARNAAVSATDACMFCSSGRAT
jgi:putative transposase